MIGTRDVRLILDRNQNGLDGRPVAEPGASISPGLYWDVDARTVLPVEKGRQADRRYVLLSSKVDISFDELVRELAMGGGGASGRAVPYHVGVGPGSH